MKNILMFAFLTSLLFNTVSAQKSRIIYLEVKLVNEEVKLVSSKVVAGKFKTPKKQSLLSNHLFYSATSSDGNELASGVVHDPTLHYVEYVNEAGELQTKKVVQDSIHIFFRIPYHPRITNVKFERVKDRPYLEWLLGKRRDEVGVITLNLNEL